MEAAFPPGCRREFRSRVNPTVSAPATPAVRRSTLASMSSSRRWPSLPEEDRWAVDLMEELLQDDSQTPKQLLARAGELRAEAANTEVEGIRSAALVLAERYEEAAAAARATSA